MKCENLDSKTVFGKRRRYPSSLANNTTTVLAGVGRDAVRGIIRRLLIRGHLSRVHFFGIFFSLSLNWTHPTAVRTSESNISPEFPVVRASYAITKTVVPAATARENSSPTVGQLRKNKTNPTRNSAYGELLLAVRVLSNYNRMLYIILSILAIFLAPPKSIKIRVLYNYNIYYDCDRNSG